MDFSAIAGAISSIQAASEIAKGLIGIRDEVQLRSKVIELQSIILAAQTSALTAQAAQGDLAEKMRTLQESLREVEGWNCESERYHLIDYGSGSFAYELRQESSAGEPLHRICPNCFHKKQKSLLQFMNRTAGGQDFYKCYGCQSDFFLGSRHDSDWGNGAVRPRRSEGWQGI